eukprot:1146795-Pelagomonas_calceolata.AAC.3
MAVTNGVYGASFQACQVGWLSECSTVLGRKVRQISSCSFDLHLIWLATDQQGEIKPVGGGGLHSHGI